MPQIDWTPEYKRNAVVVFDRLKLKVNERARIVTLEKPTFTWVHTMRAPKIVEGMATKVIKKRKDGTEFADWDMDFVGRPQCLGDHGIIEDDGLDPKNCPVCARAAESEEVEAPERRFAMNVIRYNTKSDGSVVSPFGCSSLVWTFTEGVYNKLYGIAQEHGGLVGRDMLLGPCLPPEAFQKFDIATGAKDIWTSDDRIKSVVEETHENNKLSTDELETACGRKVELKWLRDDIDKIRKRWKVAHGDSTDAGLTEKADITSLKGELDSLLAPTPAPSKQPASGGYTPPNLDTQLRSDKPAADEVKRESAPGSAVDDFSSLLEGLNLK